MIINQYLMDCFLNSLTIFHNIFWTGGIWGLLFILVIPAALLIYGFVRWMHRRKL